MTSTKSLAIMQLVASPSSGFPGHCARAPRAREAHRRQRSGLRHHRPTTACSLLAFTLSLDDLVVASFVSGPGASTLPMYIFSKVKLGVSPDINALATLIIVFVTVGVFLAWTAGRRTRRASTS